MNGIGILWNVCDGSFGVRGCGRPSLGGDAAVCAELFFAVLLFRLLLLLFSCAWLCFLVAVSFCAFGYLLPKLGPLVISNLTKHVLCFVEFLIYYSFAAKKKNFFCKDDNILIATYVLNLSNQKKLL
jgi:hypothetical protein